MEIRLSMVSRIIRESVAQDLPFLKASSALLRVSTPSIKARSSRATWPDIRTDGRSITVTREWARQGQHERRKRLVHELLHLQGREHGVIDGMVYSTRPKEDEYSRVVYLRLLRHMLGS